LVVYQISAAEHDIFIFSRGYTFQNELSSSTMPSLISFSWYLCSTLWTNGLKPFLF
jgi:hypothetical protein